MSREQPTLVIPTPGDEALCDWLTQRYSGEEYASRIQVCQWINGQRGDAVFTHDQRVEVTDGKQKSSKPKLTRERLVEISNKIVATAQADTDSLRHSTTYAVLAFHPLMGPDSYSRHLLRCTPKNALAVDPSAVVAEDSVMSTKLLLGLLSDERRHSRWSMEMAMHVASGALESANERISSMQNIVDGAWERQAKLMSATEDALSRAAKRKLEADWHAVKLAGVRDGVALLKGLVPGLAAAMTRGKVGVEQAVRQFMGTLTRAQIVALVGSEDLDAPSGGGLLSEEQAQLLRRVDRGEVAMVGPLFSSLSPAQFDQLRGLLTENQLFVIAQVADGLEEAKSSDGPTRESATQNAARPAATSKERDLIGRFLDALPEDANLKLLGDWENEDDTGIRCVSPGILAAEQVLVLSKVAVGRLPPSAIDDLLPESGTPLAVTAAQREEASSILPLGSAALLAELFALRMSARAASADGPVRQ